MTVTHYTYDVEGYLSNFGCDNTALNGEAEPLFCL